MVATARLRHLRTSARKARFVIDPLRRKSVAQALLILSTLNKRVALPVTKLVRSALANAKQKDATLSEGRLMISRIVADEGPMWKRFRAAAMGRATRIRKRTCHITIELDTLLPSAKTMTLPPRAAAATLPRPAGRARKGPTGPTAPAKARRPLKRAAAGAR